MSPVSESAKMRGMFTISASSGASIGTSMISMRKSDVFSSSSAGSPEQPGSSLDERTPPVPDT